ncbi:hypothetical protein HMPREF9597_00072 [Cutibacterium acnes HL005PA4]|nr:hypothetical protein HMPREF9567_00800 [Cutibacterium acnes HL013PA1]EFS37538.1 hypothetical protein HMPREF9574_02123 [Cutibacterium acnes HL074PA1]EFS47055.1 hypothetical protein HMPREF9580_00226 [Cutibacterium acnes HL087PA2]EFS54829.1 hypothetical protein HMPREF9589_00072 [Cutibacterium acnes HL059PA1]EFS56774.1 hypothetical protein HMPREF9593_00699 [Cutibacterium acnes HL046PA2]EFS61511.1 hypothetical protein HMPREF9605_00971 [Cutibacterium acnes HL036PA2]EFS64615.1 hypothetical protein
MAAQFREPCRSVIHTPSNSSDGENSRHGAAWGTVVPIPQAS